jgi:hypothetical protein
MQTIMRILALAFLAAAVGCGGTKELGPADETQTPQVSEEEIQKQMQQGMQQAQQGMSPEDKKRMQYQKQ